MDKKNDGPAAGRTANGAGCSHLDKQRHLNTAHSADKPNLTVCLPPDTEPISLEGREAQTLALLLKMGPRGFTSGEASPLGWARRTSAYVRKLRLAGVPILTTWETTDDARVGRYTLAGPVLVIAPGVSQ